MLGESGEGWRGVPVRLSLKSVTGAWVRGFAAAGAVVFALIGLTEATGWNQSLARALGRGALFALLKLYKGFRKASYERAVELADEAGLPAGMRVLLDVEYGVLDTEQADRCSRRSRRKRLPTTKRRRRTGDVRTPGRPALPPRNRPRGARRR